MKTSLSLGAALLVAFATSTTLAQAHQHKHHDDLVGRSLSALNRHGGAAKLIEKRMSAQSHPDAQKHEDTTPAHAQPDKHKDNKTSRKIYTGDLTYYYGRQLLNPACGGLNPTDDSMIVAVPLASPAKCGDKVRLHWQGKSVDATAIDQCAGCLPFDVDATKSVFKHLAPLEEGRLKGMQMEIIAHKA